MKAFRMAHPIWSAYLCIVLGTGLLGASIQYIFDPIGLVTGGFSGLAIVIKALTGAWIPGGIPLWATNLALNIPVFVLAYLLLGRNFIGRTLFGTVMLSAWLAFLPPLSLLPEDYLLSAIFGGVFAGGGIGLVFLGNATTGGTDLVAALIHKGLRHYSLAQIMQVLDGAIVIVGLAVFGLRPAMYALIAIFVATKVTDALLEGLKFSKAAYIISEKSEAIAEAIMGQLDRGVTGLPVVGMYTQKSRRMLYCVVSQKEIVRVKDIVEELDRNAFVIVSDVREVLGEGFQPYSGS